MDAATLETLGTPALLLEGDGVVTHVNSRWHASDEVGHRCFPDVTPAVRLPDQLRPMVARLSPTGHDDIQCDELSCGRWWRMQVRPAREAGATFVTATDVSQARRDQERAATGRTLEAVGRLGGGLAHDLNNVLTGVLGYADLLELRRGREEVGAEVAGIRTSVDRARALLEQVLAFSRRRPVQRAALDVNATLTSLHTTINDVVGPGIEVVLELSAGPCVVRMDRVPFEHIVLNIVVNARDAMRGGGVLTVQTTDRGQTAVVMLRDSGPGMDPDTVARAMEPFFSTKAPEHPGLGLSVAYGITAQYDGDLRIVSRPGAGTAVFLEVPTAEAQPTRVEAAQPEARRGRTILIAEDEVTIREVIASLLTGQGFDVVAAGDGAEALAMARQLPQPIDLLVSDVVMPTMDGPELVRHLRRDNPSLQVVFMTGYTEHALDDEALGRPAPQVLHKPFGLADLLGAITNALPPEDQV